MGFRNCHDPYGSPSILVDKMIGTAYEIVKYVAERMPALQSISDNMEDLTLIATNARKEVDLVGVASGLGITVNVAMPAGVADTDVRWVNAVIYGSDGVTYPASSTTFTVRVQSGAVRIALSPSGPAGMVNAPIAITLAYRD